MAAGKKTYGASLNAENRDDAILMDWLEGMDRGGPANIIKQGLLTEFALSAGASEIVPIGTLQQVESLRVENEQLKLSSQLGGWFDFAREVWRELFPLFKRLVEVLDSRLAELVAVQREAPRYVFSSNGNGDYASTTAKIEDDKEDPNDPLVQALLGMDFDKF
jgi:hypothetical protein